MINLRDKKVTVMGLGLYEDGSGISATRFLVTRGAKVTVTDLKTETQLAEQLKRLGKIKAKLKFVLGKHQESDFRSADLIIKNPGVPRTSKFLQISRTNNIPIMTDISLFFELIDRKRIFGVTGTRGKSTTTVLLYEFLKTVDKKAILGGNITKSPLAQMTQVKAGGLVVLELSSWLLESLEDIERSPHLAIFTNIYPDHLNTYSGMKEYVEAKKNIFKYQNLQDYTIFNRDNAYTLKLGQETPAKRFWFSLKEFKEENGCFVRAGKIIFRRDGIEQIICSVSDILLPGQHNLSNVLGAICGASIYGVKPAQIRFVLKRFRGVPNRLELLREIKGVKYYNDTTSTTPEATLVALKALSQKKNIILIAGGSDKGLDFSQLFETINKNCRKVILLKGTGTERLKQGIKNYFIVESLAEAVSSAQSFARAGEVILLSPACASFGLFVNEFDRGDQFRRLIKKL